MDKELRTAYIEAGAIHVLAVSGLHTGIIFILVTPFLKLFRLHHKLRWLSLMILLVILAAYTIVCHYPPSAVRASCMLVLWQFSRCIGLKSKAFSILALAALATLLLDPFQLNHLGFIFSYTALSGIFLIYPLLPFRKHPFIQSSRGMPIKMIWISVSAQALLSPISVYIFKQFPVYFWLSSLVAVPATMIIMYLSILCITIEAKSGFLISALDIIIGYLNHAIQSFQSLPFSQIDNIYFPVSVSCLCMFTILSISIGIKKHQRKMILGGLLSALFILPLHGAMKNRELSTAEFIIFNIQAQSLVKLYYAGIEYNLFSSPEQKDKEYLLSGLRLKKQVYDRYDVQLSNSALLEFDNISFFLTDRISAFDRFDGHYDVDIVLFHKATLSHCKNLFKTCKPRLLILDGSTFINQKRLLHTWCKEQHINLHDTGLDFHYSIKAF